MKITIACIGRSRDGAMKALFEDYARRIPWPVALKELEEKRPLPAAQRMEREAALLRAALPAKAKIIALDERGKAMASSVFAEQLGRWQDDGVPEIGFIIGGADGLDPALRKEAALILSFGAMTWPHLLVRVLLAEQLYRAHTILTGHPYHRE